MRVRYSGPYPSVHVPALGRDVDRGDEIDVPDDVVLGADWTVIQSGPDEMTVADLHKALDAADVDYPKSAKRADLQKLLDSLTGDDQ